MRLRARRPMRRSASTRCSSPASRSRGELEAISAATTLPIVLGGAPEEMTALDYLASQRVRIALQGHAPFAAATQAVYETLKALREGTSPKNLEGHGVARTDRPRDARGGDQGAQRRIPRPEEVSGGVIRHVTITRAGAGRRLSRLGSFRTGDARGLEGWVRNRRDGSVEAVFAGSQTVPFAGMIRACRRGPIIGARRPRAGRCRHRPTC